MMAQGKVRPEYSWPPLTRTGDSQEGGSHVFEVNRTKKSILFLFLFFNLFFRVKCSKYSPGREEPHITDTLLARGFNTKL